MRANTSNLEYLKNVILKFIGSVEEQEQLIPVLGMLLQFSPEELKNALVRSSFLLQFVHLKTRTFFPGFSCESSKASCDPCSLIGRSHIVPARMDVLEWPEAH